MTRTALYRAYGADDALIYVGISTDPARRWKEHACEKQWWRDEVHRKTFEWYDSNEDAARAEAAAIRNESPTRNLTLPDLDGSPNYRLRTPRPRRTNTLRTRKFVVADELWEHFSDAVERSSDPEADRSKVLRQLVRWYVGEPGAKLPERPEAEEVQR